MIGVGVGEPDWTLEWTLADGLPYELWSDLDRVLAVHYGAADSPETAEPLRIAFILDAEGQVVLEYREFLEVGPDPGDVLRDLTLLYGD